MKGLSVLFGVCVACLFSGCAVIHATHNYNGTRVEDGYEPVESVEIENSAWLIFKCIPLASGDVANPNGNDCCWFENTATLQNNLRLLDYEMARVKAKKIANLTSRKEEQTFLFFLLEREAFHTSAVLLDDYVSAPLATKAGK